MCEILETGPMEIRLQLLRLNIFLNKDSQQNRSFCVPFINYLQQKKDWHFNSQTEEIYLLLFFLILLKMNTKAKELLR